MIELLTLAAGLAFFAVLALLVGRRLTKDQKAFWEQLVLTGFSIWAAAALGVTIHAIGTGFQASNNRRVSAELAIDAACETLSMLGRQDFEFTYADGTTGRTTLAAVDTHAIDLAAGSGLFSPDETLMLRRVGTVFRAYEQKRNLFLDIISNGLSPQSEQLVRFAVRNLADTIAVLQQGASDVVDSFGGGSCGPWERSKRPPVFPGGPDGGRSPSAPAPLGDGGRAAPPSPE